MASNVAVQHLPVLSKGPIPASGGRLDTPAGELAQIINGEPIQLVTYIEFKPDGQPRGNHYHKQKTEIIYIIKGKLKLTLEDLSDSSYQTIDLESGDLIRVQPNIAHVYVAQTYTQALEMTNVPYDPSDTIAYKVKVGK